MCLFVLEHIILQKKDLRSTVIGDSAASQLRARILFKRFVFNKTKRWPADSFHVVKSDIKFLC